jgi:uncharacterized protein (TIGR03643 family)
MSKPCFSILGKIVVTRNLIAFFTNIEISNIKKLKYYLINFQVMKKSSRAELDREALDRIVTLAQEERKPFEEIKAQYGLSEKEVTDIMKQKLSHDNFELWKKKTAAKRPKPKPINAIVDDGLDSKYYIRNKF